MLMVNKRVCTPILKMTVTLETQKGTFKANGNNYFSHYTYGTHYFKYLKESTGVPS